MFEQAENESGYFVYLNKINGKTQNEDPKLLEILHGISIKYNNIKYTTYRSSAKLFALQKSLQSKTKDSNFQLEFLNCLKKFLFFFEALNIPFPIVTSILEHHQIVDTSHLVKPHQLTSVIFDIFYATNRLGYYTEDDEFDIQTACSVLANFFWNVFDS